MECSDEQQFANDYKVLIQDNWSGLVSWNVCKNATSCYHLLPIFLYTVNTHKQLFNSPTISVVT